MYLLPFPGLHLQLKTSAAQGQDERTVYIAQINRAEAAAVKGIFPVVVQYKRLAFFDRVWEGDG